MHIGGRNLFLVRRAAASEIIPDMIARPRRLISGALRETRCVTWTFFFVFFFFSFFNPPYAGVSSRCLRGSRQKYAQVMRTRAGARTLKHIHSLRTRVLKQRRSAASPSIPTSTPYGCHFSSGSSTDTRAGDAFPLREVFRATQALNAPTASL